MTILATVIVLGVLIFVHELGHFAAAKAVGVRVVRFSIGLPPKIFGIQRGETEYVLGAIPLGGYVKMGGMDDEVMERIEGGGEPREPGPRDFDAQPIWARTFVISAGVIMNMLFAFVVYTFVNAKWGVAELSTTRVAYIDVANLPAGTEALAENPAGSRFGPIGGAFIDRVTDFQRFLAPPPQTPKSGMKGESLFVQIGCAKCHVRSFTTSRDSELEEVIRDKPLKPYSDFLLHDMGLLGDGIAQGEAGERELAFAIGPHPVLATLRFGPGAGRRAERLAQRALGGNAAADALWVAAVELGRA